MQAPTPPPTFVPGPPGQGRDVATTVEHLKAELAGVSQTPSANAIYEALKNAHKELEQQQEGLESTRRGLLRQLDQIHNDAAQKGIEQRIAQIDQRLAVLDKQLADNEALVAKAAAVPGAVVQPPPDPPRNGPPDEAYAFGAFFTFIVFLPLSIAFARRIWRRSAVAVTKLPQEIYDRFARVDQSLDAIAIEVERIGEGQRYLTRMHTEQGRALGAGPAERIDAVERERERQSRK